MDGAVNLSRWLSGQASSEEFKSKHVQLATPLLMRRNNGFTIASPASARNELDIFRRYLYDSGAAGGVNESIFWVCLFTCVYLSPMGQQCPR